MGWLHMTHHSMNLRSGLTAIAAVLALSSTPLVAQEVETPPDPVIETTSEPAPEPSTSAPEASEATPTKEAASAPAETRRTAARSRPTTSSRTSSQPVAPSRAPAATEATAEAIPVPPPAAAPVTDPFAPAEPVAVEEPVADGTLPIAGAAGLGLLALGAIGLAVQGRRRRREERAHQRANQQYLAEHPEEPTPRHDVPAFHRTNPAMAVAPPVSGVRTDVPRTKLPEGFDLSRFGPHTQAAYLGPTDDNPSLSLKHRLRRAAAMDQMARHDVVAPRPERPAARRKPAMEPMWAANGDSFMLRRAGDKQTSKPAFQH